MAYDILKAGLRCDIESANILPTAAYAVRKAVGWRRNLASFSVSTAWMILLYDFFVILPNFTGSALQVTTECFVILIQENTDEISGFLDHRYTFFK
jgi:hypothetical protein